MHTYVPQKNEAKDQSCAKKKHFYSSHYLHFCLKMHVYSAQRTKYMFLCNKTVCLLLDDEGLNKVSTILKHTQSFRAYLLLGWGGGDSEHSNLLSEADLSAKGHTDANMSK